MYASSSTRRLLVRWVRSVRWLRLVGGVLRLRGVAVRQRAHVVRRYQMRHRGIRRVVRRPYRMGSVHPTHHPLHPHPCLPLFRLGGAMRRLHARHLLVPCGRRHRHGVLHRAAVDLLPLPPHLWLRLRLPPPSPPNLSRVPTLALPQRMCRRVLQAARSQLVRGG